MFFYWFSLSLSLHSMRFHSLRLFFIYFFPFPFSTFPLVLQIMQILSVWERNKCGNTVEARVPNLESILLSESPGAVKCLNCRLNLERINLNVNECVYGPAARSTGNSGNQVRTSPSFRRLQLEYALPSRGGLFQNWMIHNCSVGHIGPISFETNL